MYEEKDLVNGIPLTEEVKRAVLSEAGSKGGHSKSIEKRAASRANLKKARARRWNRVGKPIRPIKPVKR